MKCAHRLRTPADFQRVRDQSPRVWPHRLLALHVAPNDLERVRVGITVSSRVGKAVVRNRIRRRLQAALGTRLSALPDGFDVLIVARPPSAAATWPELCAALDVVLQRAAATVGAGARV
ncbi:MAG: ribonuclease P protein component [Chloroflexi bacterium]|nr:ribonuclease P protein component [Chloroflexota bacterium]